MAEIEIDEIALEVARRAVEDELIEFRDSGMFMVGGNGFVIRDKDGSPSSIMRLSTEFGLQTGIKAYLAALANPQQCPNCTSPYRHHHFVMPTADGTEICADAWHDQDQTPTETSLAAEDDGRWRVDHPGIGVLAYDTEVEARTAAGTAGTLIPPGGAS